MKPNQLLDLRMQVADFVRERDWEQFHDAKNLSMAIATEAAELMELFRWIPNHRCRSEIPEAARYELADILIFCISFANRYDIDIHQCVTEKIRRNAQKYPADQFKGKYE